MCIRSEDEDEAVAFTDVMAAVRAAAAGCTPVEGRGETDGRVEGFVESVVPGYTDAIFRIHFRMARPTFQLLAIY